MLGLMTVGYAAFQTNLNITAKGNILKKELNPEKLKEQVVTSGPGLYKDDIEKNKYIYKGKDPDNYIKLDNDLWRIISIEPDNTLKIIKYESLGRMVYDPGYATSIAGVTSANSMTGTRWSSTSTDYCYYDSSTTTYWGCNVWGSKTTMLNSSGTNITKMPREVGSSTTYDLPDKEAYLNTYLNGTWYNTLSDEVKALVNTHTWNVGLLKEQTGQTLETDLAQESAYKWRGKVGLINAIDYIKTNTNKELCGNVYANTSATGNSAACKTTTWLFHDNSHWTLSPYSTSLASRMWLISSAGDIYKNGTSGTYSVHPVVYLSSDIGLSGSGTSNEPFTIN